MPLKNAIFWYFFQHLGPDFTGFTECQHKNMKIFLKNEIFYFDQIFITSTSHQRINLGKVISTRSQHQHSQIQHWNSRGIEFKTTLGYWIQYPHVIFNSLKSLTSIPPVGLFVLEVIDFNTCCRCSTLNTSSCLNWGFEALSQGLGGSSWGLGGLNWGLEGPSGALEAWVGALGVWVSTLKARVKALKARVKAL